MHDMFQKIAEHHNAQFRLCKTLVAGFKATNEQDLTYMDGYMDTLFDFMDPGGETEALYRDYLAHIATFNPQEAKKYEESLDEHLGYKIHVEVFWIFISVCNIYRNEYTPKLKGTKKCNWRFVDFGANASSFSIIKTIQDLTIR